MPKLAITLLCLLIGGFLLLIGMGIIPHAESDANAPGPVIALGGLIFLVAGAMVLVGMKSRYNDLLAAVFCAILGVVAGWVSLYGTDTGFSGGLPLISRDTNVAIARAVFGFGAFICFAISAWALTLFLRASSE